MDTLFKDFNITVSLCTILLLSSIDTLINPGSLRFDFKFFTIRFGCKIYRKQVTVQYLEDTSVILSISISLIPGAVIQLIIYSKT